MAHIEDRQPGQEYPPTALNQTHSVNGGRGLLFTCAVFDDACSLGYFDLDSPVNVRPVSVTGIVHSGRGEMGALTHIAGDRFTLGFNIDGASWLYEATFDAGALQMNLHRALVGRGELSNGTLEAVNHETSTDRYVLSFSTATSPTQIYVLEGADRTPSARTRELIIGIPQAHMAPGEDASFTSHDGLRVSARLYLPSNDLVYEAPYPVVYYIHGGP
jgi:hypothetical protein